MKIDWMPGAIGAFVKKEGGRVLQVLTANRDDNCVLIGKPGFVGQRADGSGNYHVFSEYWRWVPRIVEWNGEDLPPVGVIVKLRTKRSPEDAFEGWGKAEIMYSSKGAVVWRWQGHSQEFGAEWDEVEFEAIRTPEQIAAEERDQARTEVLNAMTADGKLSDETEDQWQYRLKVVGEMLDMGYRKQVTP